MCAADCRTHISGSLQLVSNLPKQICQLNRTPGVGGRGEGVRGAGVTWERVRLLSHGLCLQGWADGRRGLDRSLCKKRNCGTFSCSSLTSWNAESDQGGAALSKQTIMEIPAINLKVRFTFCVSDCLGLYAQTKAGFQWNVSSVPQW